MSNFAKIENEIVTQVIVAEQDFIDTLEGEWIQTSYNTFEGVHPENRPLRKNYAGIGYTYDRERDAFIPPKPFPSWILIEEKCIWEPPVPYPLDGKLYKWNDEIVEWEFVADPPPLPPG